MMASRYLLLALLASARTLVLAFPVPVAVAPLSAHALPVPVAVALLVPVVLALPAHAQAARLAAGALLLVCALPAHVCHVRHVPRGDHHGGRHHHLAHAERMAWQLLAALRRPHGACREEYLPYKSIP